MNTNENSKVSTLALPTFTEMVQWLVDDDLASLQAADAQVGHLIHVSDGGVTLLMWASNRGQLDIVQWLLSKGVDVNFFDMAGRTALHWAAKTTHVECLDALLSHPNIDPHWQAHGLAKATALMVAAENGQLACVRRLLIASYDSVNHVDNLFESVLDKAIKNKHLDCLAAMLEAPFLKDERIQSALLTAAAEKQWDCLDLLGTRADPSQYAQVLAQAPATRLPKTLALFERIQLQAEIDQEAGAQRGPACALAGAPQPQQAIGDERQTSPSPVEEPILYGIKRRRL